MNNILDSIKNNEEITREQAKELLSIDCTTDAFYDLVKAVNRSNRKRFNGQGYVFAQIGIDARPCSGGCKFCSMAEEHYCVEASFIKSKEEVVKEAKLLASQPITDLFLMTTAEYDITDLISIVKAVKSVMPKHMKLVVNTHDFGIKEARELKNAGATGVYHIHRLREGEDTAIDSSTRIETLDAIKETNLDLYYCIEPIGPEHTYDEILDEIYRAKEYGCNVMAVMRRTPVKGTPLWEKGAITALETIKIAAVTSLIVKPERSMNIHEIIPTSLMCGINQLYAEYGSNPRDNISRTEKGRGFTIQEASDLLIEYGWKVL